MLTRRRSLPVVAAVAVALLLTSCSSVGPQPAATVNGVKITDDALRAEIDQMNKEPRFLADYENNFGAKLQGEGKGTFSRQFITSLLFLRIEYLLVEQELDRTGNPISPSDMNAALRDLRNSFSRVDGGAQLLNSFSDTYRNRLARDNAIYTVADQVARDKLGSAEEYYDTHKSEFQETCVSHILVSSSRADAKARAIALKKQLDNGADFAELAKKESDDAGSAKTGGSLDCVRPGLLVAEFQKAMDAATIGEPTDPVESQFGYHIILVHSRRIPPFADVQGFAEQKVSSAGDQSVQSFLRNAVCSTSADVHVSSRYGSWDRSGCKGGNFARITPVTGPTTTARLGG